MKGLTFITWKVSNTQQLNMKMPHEVNVIDLNIPITENFTCLKTNQLFKVIRTTICVHNSADFVSNHFISNYIYEEKQMHVLFPVMLRYPHLGFIDVGANIGTYTMFAALLTRLVIAIECFKPNTMRIAKAIQIENLRNKVILIENAVYSHSGRYLRLSSHFENIGGQGISNGDIGNKSRNDPYIVKTIRFDDILPIIKQTKFRSFLMKIDIERSEHHVFETGTELFNYVDVPIIHIEWDKMHYQKEHGNNVVSFFTERGCIPTTDTCEKLNMTNVFSGWPANVFWTKMNLSAIC